MKLFLRNNQSCNLRRSKAGAQTLEKCVAVHTEETARPGQTGAQKAVKGRNPGVEGWGMPLF